MSSGIVQRSLRALGIDAPNNALVVRLQSVRRKLRRTDAKLRDEYLRRASVPRLQIGGGWHRLEGWLDADLEMIPGVLQMDATRRFPFEDGTFQYVYTEHMIEHISREEGAFMLGECYRILRKGGVIRVVTPNLVAIAGLCGENLSDIQQSYLSWLCSALPQQKLPHTTASAIDAMFRLWGHKFIYDEPTLAAAMRSAGFGSIVRRPLGESEHPDLRNLENTQRYPDGFLEFESVALEGQKLENGVGGIG